MEGASNGSCASPLRRKALNPLRAFRLNHRFKVEAPPTAFWKTLLFSEHPMSASQKLPLRRLLRARRRALTGRHRAHAERRIARAIARLLQQRASSHIAAYLPFDGEVDLRPLIARHSNRFWLPVIQRNGSLRFRSARALPSNHRHGARNRYGIVEPRPSTIKTAGGMDIILLPLVGFDRQGHRLGMGAGFYDKTLSTLRRPRPLLIGIAFACQQVNQLPHDPWDIPLDAIITEYGLRRFPLSQGARHELLAHEM